MRTSKPDSRAKKSDRIPTHLVTLEMLNQKLSLESIASKRGLALTTIIVHIEKNLSLKLIDKSSLSHVRDSIPIHDFDVIAKELKKSTDGKLTPIYETFCEKYSYEDIRIVRLLM